MAVSYKAIVGQRRATLPSVEMWNTNMNIVREPPKSIHTRRRDKVGSTSSITQMIADSGDRSREAIKIYPRGVNPMVSVDYGTHGGNSGQHGGGLNQGFTQIGGRSASLAYKIMNGGAFRPPVMTQAELLPLSRQARPVTYAITNKGLADYRKKLYTQHDKYRNIRQNPMNISIKPTKVFKMNSKLIEPFEIKYVIKNPIKVSAHSRKIDQRAINRHTHHIGTHDHNTTIRDISTIAVDSNVSDTAKFKTNIISMKDLTDVRPSTQDVIHMNVDSGKRGIDKIEYLNTQVPLTRNTNIASAYTNKRDKTVHKKIKSIYAHQHKRNRPVASNTMLNKSVPGQGTFAPQNRSIKLTPRISIGSTHGSVAKPQIYKENGQGISQNQRQRNMNKRVLNMTLGRDNKNYNRFR